MLKFDCSYGILHEVIEAASMEEAYELWVCRLCLRVEVLTLADVVVKSKELDS